MAKRGSQTQALWRTWTWGTERKFSDVSGRWNMVKTLDVPSSMNTRTRSMSWRRDIVPGIWTCKIDSRSWAWQSSRPTMTGRRQHVQRPKSWKRLVDISQQTRGTSRSGCWKATTKKANARQEQDPPQGWKDSIPQEDNTCSPSIRCHRTGKRLQWDGIPEPLDSLRGANQAQEASLQCHWCFEKSLWRQGLCKKKASEESGAEVGKDGGDDRGDGDNGNFAGDNNHTIPDDNTFPQLRPDFDLGQSQLSRFQCLSTRGQTSA